MNFLFAPSESRAQDFLKNNRFGLDDRVKICLDHQPTDGMRFTDGDTVYVLDGVSRKAMDILHRNVAIGRTKPRLISVEER